jgi:hypothetical protein
VSTLHFRSAALRCQQGPKARKRSTALIHSLSHDLGVTHVQTHFVRPAGTGRCRRIRRRGRQQRQRRRPGQHQRRRPRHVGQILEARKSAKFKDWSDFIERVPGFGNKRAVKLSAEGLTVNGEAFKGAATMTGKKAVTVAANSPASPNATKPETKQ